MKHWIRRCGAWEPGTGGQPARAGGRAGSRRGNRAAADWAAAVPLAAVVATAVAVLPQPVAGRREAGPVAAVASLAGPAGAWSWPVAGRGGDPPAVLKAFDPPAHGWLAGHRGADLEAAPGDAVRAPSAGTVVFAGTVVDRPVLTIDHGNGLLSSFEPVGGTPPAGTVVAAGAAVGRVGAGGHCGDRCVHWGLRLEGVYIDPLDTVADRRPSVLLPVPEAGR